MRVTDRITAQRFGVDEAYERFFDGFYNLGRPADGFERTVVLAPPRREPITPKRPRRAHRPVKAGRGRH